jgi:hypothetical protein
MTEPLVSTVLLADTCEDAGATLSIYAGLMLAAMLGVAMLCFETSTDIADPCLLPLKLHCF